MLLLLSTLGKISTSGSKKILIRYVNYIFTFVFSRRDGILHLSNPRPAYARKNLREASVKVRVPSEHLSEDI